MIGRRIRLARKSAGITQKELANIIDIDVDTILNYEKNRTCPNSTMLIRLSKALKVRTEYFFRPDVIDNFKVICS